MPVTIPVEIEGFAAGSPWASLNGTTQNYQFTAAEVLRAAIVAGYWDEISIPSLEYRRWRAATIRMAVRRKRGALVRPPEWRQLDSSEKATITSLLGVITTKLLTERILGAPYLLFLDVHFNLVRRAGAPRLRPDFVALAPQGTGWRYFSLEAKGRARFSQATLDKGKDQAKSLGRVDGIKVKAHVVCYTTMPAGRLAARFHDPTPDEENLHETSIINGESLSAYYRSLQALYEFREETLERVSRIGSHDTELTRLPELDVAVGIHPLVLGAMDSPERLHAVLPKLATLSAETKGEVGLDGIVVVPGQSWLKTEA
jgi:hypothetical protein